MLQNKSSICYKKITKQMKMKWTFNALFRLTFNLNVLQSFVFFFLPRLAFTSYVVLTCLLYGCLPPLTFWTHDETD